MKTTGFFDTLSLQSVDITILVPGNAIHWISYRALTEIRGYKKAIPSQIVATIPFHFPFSCLALLALWVLLLLVFSALIKVELI